MAGPVVSVIIPVYNGADFVASAVANVFGNGYDHLQVLVVNDGSTDDTTRRVIELPYPVEYLEQPNAGPAAARNCALHRVRGEMVAFLDVDDRWPPGRLAQHVTALLAHPEAGIAQGRVQRIHLTPHQGGGWVEKPELRPYHFVNLGSATYRRALFDQVGLFDETLRFNEDTDWFFRAWELGVHKHQLPEVALYYRLHDRNLTQEFHTVPGYGLPRLFKRHLERQRQGLARSDHSRIADLARYIGWPDITAAEAGSKDE